MNDLACAGEAKLTPSTLSSALVTRTRVRRPATFGGVANVPAESGVKASPGVDEAAQHELSDSEKRLCLANMGVLYRHTHAYFVFCFDSSSADDILVPWQPDGATIRGAEPTCRARRETLSEGGHAAS